MKGRSYNDCVLLGQLCSCEVLLRPVNVGKLAILERAFLVHNIQQLDMTTSITDAKGKLQTTVFIAITVTLSFVSKTHYMCDTITLSICCSERCQRERITTSIPMHQIQPSKKYSRFSMP